MWKDNRFNILLALSNLYAYSAIRQAWIKREGTTARTILIASVMSFLYHLFESHKHQLYGFGSSKQLSHVLFVLDVMSASFLFFCMMRRAIQSKLYQKQKYIVLWTLSFLLLVGSEYATLLLRNGLQAFWFTFLHCAWHGVAFETVLQILLDT